MPKAEIINEVICNGMLKVWQIVQPDVAQLKINKSLIDEFELSGGKLDRIYENIDYRTELFFASKRVENTVDFAHFPNRIPKKELNTFASPTDLLKIGCFDFWVGNKDRKPENPNTIISTNSDGKFLFIPIDHARAFADFSNYMEITKARLNYSGAKNILSSNIVKSIGKLELKGNTKILEDNILECMAQTNKCLDDIFETIPSEWGFSKKAKNHLKAILGDEDRNKQIASRFLNYL